jgi:prophage regulatory protein
MLTLGILVSYCQAYKPARCLLPSTLPPSRPPRSEQPNASDQYALTFQPQAGVIGPPNEAGRRSSLTEKRSLQQHRRIPPELDPRNLPSQSQSTEFQSPEQRMARKRSKTRFPGVSVPSWQSVPKKLPQSQDPVQETRKDYSGSPDDLSFLRLPDVKAMTGLSKTSLYAMIRNKSFPAPVRLGPRAVAWLRSEVRRWAVERVHASRSAA